MESETGENGEAASRAAGDAESLSVSPVLLAAVQSAGTAVRHVVHSPPVKNFCILFQKIKFAKFLKYRGGICNQSLIMLFEMSNVENKSAYIKQTHMGEASLKLCYNEYFF